jgi:hypothetical protein
VEDVGARGLDSSAMRASRYELAPEPPACGRHEEARGRYLAIAVHRSIAPSGAVLNGRVIIVDRDNVPKYGTTSSELELNA